MAEQHELVDSGSVSKAQGQDRELGDFGPVAADIPSLIILNNSLADSELHHLLKMQQQLKIKVSSGMLPHTCLYPQSSVAFMLLPTTSVLSSWPPTQQSHILPQIAEHLEKFSRLHHKCYVLVTSPLMGKNEQAILSLLQDKFLTNQIQFLPMHNSKECVSCMQNIARLSSRPLSALVRKRMVALESQLASEENVLCILKELGLDQRESLMVMDACGGIAGLVRATAGELADLNLDQGTIRRVMNLLHSQPS